MRWLWSMETERERVWRQFMSTDFLIGERGAVVRAAIRAELVKFEAEKAKAEEIEEDLERLASICAVEICRLAAENEALKGRDAEATETIIDLRIKCAKLDAALARLGEVEGP